ncbi:MAG: MFS transporter [Pseudodesulfovibrio sp.]|uniref:MFS transporter n=1 Tax=Pseudodesulfovibrio sp. TaxID=2035812 RepID=UPI003D144EF7
MKSSVFTSLFISTVVVMLGIGVIAPILPLYAHGMGASGFQIGAIFSGFALSRLFLAPLVGRFADQHRKKRILMAGLILFIAVSLAYVSADSPTLLLLIRLIQGGASVLVTPVAQSYVGDITPVGQEGRIGNLYFMSMFMGMAGGPYLGGWLCDHYGMAAPFYAMSVLSFLALLLILFLVPDAPATTPKSGKSPSGFKGLLPIFRDRPMWGVMTYFATRGFYRWGFNSFFPMLAVKVSGASVTGVGVVLSSYMLAGSLVQYPCGLLVDRFPRHRVAFVFWGGVLAALSMCAIAYCRTMVMFFLLSLAMGLLSSVSRAACIAIQTERGRIHGMGAAAGAFTSSMSLGQVTGPLVLGLIVDWSAIPTAFIVAGLVGLAGALASAYLLSQNGGGRTAS